MPALLHRSGNVWKNAHTVTECGKNETVEIALMFLETPRAVHHLDECFQNVLVLLYTKRKRKFGGVVIHRLICDGFTGMLT